MTVAASFENLSRLAGELRDVVTQRLHWAVIDGKPPGAEHALADRLDQHVIDLAACLQEACGAARDGASHAVPRLDLDATCLALVRCQDQLRQARRLFDLKISAPETLIALHSLGTASDEAEWAGWARGVADALADCPTLIIELEDEIAACWTRWAEMAAALAMGARRDRIERRAERRPSDLSGN